MSLHRLKTLIFPLSFLLLPNLLWGQYNLDEKFSSSANQWLVLQLPDRQDAQICPPDLNPTAQGPSALDEAIAPYTNNRQLERECIDLLFSDDCTNYYTLGALSDLYFQLFQAHLSEAQLDQDYRFLPLVLSGLNTSFETLNHAGLWRLDRMMARLCGLTINRELDERKVPELATRAAVQLLQHYEERYQGDQLRVVLAMLQGSLFADRFKASDELSADLKQTLTMLKVCMRIYSHTEREFLLPKWIEITDNYREVELTDTLIIAAIGAVLNLERDLIHKLNPAFSAEVVFPNERVPFLLPKEAAVLLTALSDSISNFEPPVLVEAPPSRRQAEGQMTTYKVRSGDVLGTIARKFGVRVNDLKDWNNLRSDRINVGQELIIYGNQSNSKAVEPPATKPTTPETTQSQSRSRVELYTVRAGDSLWLIARNYPGVSAENIMEWNAIGTDIQPGMELKIYLP